MVVLSICIGVALLAVGTLAGMIWQNNKIVNKLTEAYVDKEAIELTSKNLKVIVKPLVIKGNISSDVVKESLGTSWVKLEKKEDK